MRGGRDPGRDETYDRQDTHEDAISHLDHPPLSLIILITGHLIRKRSISGLLTEASGPTAPGPATEESELPALEPRWSYEAA
jgi:hypothetical protein